MFTVAPARPSGRAPCFTIWRAAAWPQRKTPLRFTRRTRSKSSSEKSRKSPAFTMPALATMTSRRPKAATAESTSAVTCALSPTSQATKTAPAPSPCSPSAAPHPLPWFMTQTTTLPPSATTQWADTDPTPTHPHRRVPQRRHLRPVASVAGDEDRLRPLALQPLGRLLALRLVDVGEHDLRALGGEALGAAVADARRRPGDHDDLVFHAHGLGSFCFKMFPLPSAGEGCEALVRSKIEPTRSWVRELLPAAR